MKTPHKHAELIKAWADGAEIEYWRDPYGWESCACNSPSWGVEAQYRIKPEPKPDVVVDRMLCVTVVDDDTYITLAISNYSNCRFVFDGETGKLKSAEVL
jgi:hypothetical protein